jgi:hypothetical protein
MTLFLCDFGGRTVTLDVNHAIVTSPTQVAQAHREAAKAGAALVGSGTTTWTGAASQESSFFLTFCVIWWPYSQSGHQSCYCHILNSSIPPPTVRQQKGEQLLFEVGQLHGQVPHHRDQVFLPTYGTSPNASAHPMAIGTLYLYFFKLLCPQNMAVFVALKSQNRRQMMLLVYKRHKM